MHFESIAETMAPVSNPMHSYATSRSFFTFRAGFFCNSVFERTEQVNNYSQTRLRLKQILRLIIIKTNKAHAHAVNCLYIKRNQKHMLPYLTSLRQTTKQNERRFFQQKKAWFGIQNKCCCHLQGKRSFWFVYFAFVVFNSESSH